MPNQAQDYAKAGLKISQIKLRCRTNMPNRTHKSGSNQATTTRPTGKKNPVILSTPVSDKGVGHTYNQEKQTRSQNAEAERSIIGCETVKICARTPWASTTRNTEGLASESSSSMRRRKRSAFPLSDLGVHCASKAKPCENKHEKCLEPPTVGTLKPPKESTLAAL